MYHPVPAPWGDSVLETPYAGAFSREVAPEMRRARYQRFQRWLRWATVLLDLTLINAAVLIAYGLRYGLQIGGEVAEANHLDLLNYLPIQLALSAILLSMFSGAGLYRPAARFSLASQGAAILAG